MNKTIKTYIILLFLIISNIDQIKSNEAESQLNSLRRLSIANQIYGNSNILSYYYTNLYVGDSQKKQSYILDTSRSITSSPCEDHCQKCGNHENGYYKLGNATEILSCDSELCGMADSLCNDNKCSFTATFYENSTISGIYTKSKVKFNDYDEVPIKDIPIGCTINEDNLFFFQKVDGILGLGNNDKSFVSTLKKLNIIKKDIFSLCFAQEGGLFEIENIDEERHLEKAVYFPLKKNNSYNIEITSIKVNQNKFVIDKDENNTPKYSAVIDSGTTLTYLPTKIYDFIIKKTNDICENSKCGQFNINKEVGPCFDFENEDAMNEAINNVLPNFIYTISDKYDYVLTPKDYIFKNYVEKDFQICLGFVQTNYSSLILGSTWMHGHDIIFDRENGKIGFATANCLFNEKEYINKKISNIEKAKEIIEKNEDNKQNT